MSEVDVYVTGLGKFLPNEPIANDDIQSIIGRIGAGSEKLGRATLRRNGIRRRHYSCRKDGSYSHSNAEMASLAVSAAAEAANLSTDNIEVLATSTTQGDYLVPGFASCVHADLGVPDLEIASFQSVCAGSLMAAKHAWMSVKTGSSMVAVACGSEFSSRWFRPEYYAPFYKEDSRPDPELEFLRWTLSDGAGAIVMEPTRGPGKQSLRIDWIEQRSFAHRFPRCMYAGAVGNKEEDGRPWSLFENPGAAYSAGAIALRQDFAVLYDMFPAWVGYYLKLVDEGRIQPAEVNHFLPHYSAESLRLELKKLLEKTGAMISEDRWYNNLATCGNTGSASIFIMLEGLMHSKTLRAGETILCFVPESGRAICSFMHLTVT